MRKGGQREGGDVVPNSFSQDSLGSGCGRDDPDLEQQQWPIGRTATAWLCRLNVVGTIDTCVLWLFLVKTGQRGKATRERTVFEASLYSLIALRIKD